MNYKVFLIRYWPVFFLIIGFRVRGIEKILKALGKWGRWSDIETVKLPEIRLGTAMLKKHYLLMFWIYLLPYYGEESNGMNGSLGNY